MDPDSCMTEFVQFIEFIEFDENSFILEKLDSLKSITTSVAIGVFRCEDASSWILNRIW